MNENYQDILDTLKTMGAPDDVTQELRRNFQHYEDLTQWLRAYVLPLVMQNTLTADQGKRDHQRMVDVIECVASYPKLRMGAELIEGLRQAGRLG